MISETLLYKSLVPTYVVFFNIMEHREEEAREVLALATMAVRLPPVTNSLTENVL